MVDRTNGTFKGKRKLYFSYLDEKDAPLRGNLSEAIKIKNEQFKNKGWNINVTNTYRYVYAVPKIKDKSAAGTGTNFSGYNLWANYRKTSYIPSYIADKERLGDQGFLGPEQAATPPEEKTDVIIADAKNTDDEQFVYRNLVIGACQPVINPDETNMIDPTCFTTATPVKLGDYHQLTQIGETLLWNLDVFLQYVADNTFQNFQRAGFGHRLIQETIGELRLVETLLFQDKNYKIDDTTGNLVSPPLNPRDEGSRYPILGIRPPTMTFPWT